MQRRRRAARSLPCDAVGEFAPAGLSLQDDVEGAFVCDLIDGDLAEQLLASLYVPDVDPARMDVGREVVRRCAGSTITTPIRLLVATG